MIKELSNSFKQKNIQVGYLYFFIHFVTEVACFYFLWSLYGNNAYIWTITLIYDAIAFVPQSLIGYISDKFPMINMGVIGTILLVISLLLLNMNLYGKFLALIILLCVGGAVIIALTTFVVIVLINKNKKQKQQVVEMPKIVSYDPQTGQPIYDNDSQKKM